MESLAFLFDLIVHLDMHLRNFVAAHGAWVYALLFLIIFVETGLVVTPFMPGDSLLFVVGALCGAGLISLPLSIGLLTAAAIAGNQCNYAIGRHFGPKVFRWEQSRYFNRHAFDVTHAFYEKYGGITIVAARFLPLLRSFAPFVAGVAEMRHARFTLFDVSGGVAWVTSLTVAGYLFGNIPWVQEHLDKIILALIAATVLMAFVGSWRGKSTARRRGA
jgi:membrane-associated protein